MARIDQKSFSRIIIAEERDARQIARGLHHDLRQVLSDIGSDLENAVRQIEGKELKTGGSVENSRKLILAFGLKSRSTFKKTKYLTF
jgi:signal transduction histidine kinase